ncbi:MULTISPECIES: hypothetical protein [Psychrobacter]|uniref:hypothetical protein n=1 Tax=Psychrobacter TaxID=497 RepID=UPI000ECCDD80|nr:MULTISPECIES: hypothetical protein [Psychrobacter]HCH26975.1 hypothetical protein [Psychrobacter sp.]
MTETTDNVIHVANTDITIKRVKVKNLNEVTRAFTPFVAEFERIVKANKGLPESELMSLIGSYTDETVILASVLTDQSPAFYRELEPLEMLTVIQEVVAHSGDFFMRQIFIPLKSLGAQLALLGTTAYYHSTKSDSENPMS